MKTYTINVAVKKDTFPTGARWEHEANIVLPAGMSKDKALEIRMRYSAALGDSYLLTVTEIETVCRRF